MTRTEGVTTRPRPTYSFGRPIISCDWLEASANEELVRRDKCNLDLFWLKDESLLDADNLPDRNMIAGEIVEDLRVALGQIEEILGDLGGVG